MLTVKVLGGGCSSCTATYKLIEEVAHEKGVELMLEKIESIQDIIAYDVMSTPGVVIDEKVVHRGGVPSRSVVEDWISKD